MCEATHCSVYIDINSTHVWNAKKESNGCLPYVIELIENKDEQIFQTLDLIQNLHRAGNKELAEEAPKIF